MTDHDPRKDPREGDILRVGTERREVSYGDGKVVVYWLDMPTLGGKKWGLISAWRNWANNAEVIHAAD